MRNHLKLILLCLILIGMIILAYGVGDIRESDTGLTDEQVHEIIVVHTPTSPDSFNELSKQEDVLAVFGTIPEKSSWDESFEWWLTVKKVAGSIDAEELREVSPYVRSIGAHLNGYLFVHISKTGKDSITTEDLESIKRIVAVHAKKQNIKDMPLIFSVAELIQAY